MRNWGENIKINAKVNASYRGSTNLANALRQQRGFGDEIQHTQLESILDGSTELVFGGTDGKAQTILEDGRRVVHLGDGATTDWKELGILLGHEAYRDGVAGEAKSQFIETANAVYGHTAMAMRMADDKQYSRELAAMIAGNQNLKDDIQSLKNALRNNDFTSFAEYVGENYDFSADYWLFKLDGSVVDDGKNYFSHQAINVAGLMIDQNGNMVDENGKVIRKATEDDIKFAKIEGSDFTGSKIQALVTAIGLDNVKGMLKNSVKGMCDLSDEVIASVMNIDEQTAHEMKNRLPTDVQNKIFEAYESKFIGETLMFENGNHYTEGKWQGGDVKIPGLEENDSLGVIRNKDGTYQFFTAGLTFTRENDAFDIYKNGKTKDSDTTYEQRDNTDVIAWKRDLFTNKLTTEVFENSFTSIDRISGTTSKIGNDTYTGNTLVSEYMKMHLVDYWNTETYGVDRVGVFTNAKTLSGRELNKYGVDGTDWNRYLYHPFGTGAGSKGCSGPMSDSGVSEWNDPRVTGSGAYYFQQQLDLFDNWGIYKGFEFNIQLKGKIKP